MTGAIIQVAKGDIGRRIAVQTNPMQKQTSPEK
jgi:hypothetical protein